jgi:hypothetical protein
VRFSGILLRIPLGLRACYDTCLFVCEDQWQRALGGSLSTTATILLTGVISIDLPSLVYLQIEMEESSGSNRSSLRPRLLAEWARSLLSTSCCPSIRNAKALFSHNQSRWVSRSVLAPGGAHVVSMTQKPFMQLSFLAYCSEEPSLHRSPASFLPPKECGSLSPPEVLWGSSAHKQGEASTVKCPR